MFINKKYSISKTAAGMLFILIMLLLQTSTVFGQMLHTGKPDTAKKCAVCHFQWVNTFHDERIDGQLVARPDQEQVGRREMCISCHDGSITDSRRSMLHGYEHKIGEKPSSKVQIPEEFPLDENGLMQCATCHSPHSLPSNMEKPYGLFLRAENRDSSICLFCHKDKSGGHLQGNHPLEVNIPADPDKITLNGGKIGTGNKIICETCHAAHGAPYEKHIILPVKDTASSSILCELCHSNNPPLKNKHPEQRSHTVNTVPSRTTLPDKFSSDEPICLGINKEIVCRTCHKPHNSPEPKGLLIKNNNRDSLCTECHQQQNKISGTSHDLCITAPETKNIQGDRADTGGPCSVCHLAHSGKGPLLWSRQYKNNSSSPDDLCLGCHSKGKCAVDKIPHDYSHKTGIALSSDMQNIKLPLYDINGSERSDGLMTCMTCHNIHDPAPLISIKDKKEIKHGNFLRLSINTQSELCIHCHTAKSLIAGTDHDLSFSNSDYLKKHSLKYKQTSVCSACHSAHNAKTEKFLWSAPLGPTESESWTAPFKTKNHLMISLCTGCHNPEGCSAEKTPVRALHPDGFTISENIINTDQINSLQKQFPFFTPNGKKNNLGNIVCSTCHNPHQWDGDLNKKGNNEVLEGNVTNSFLRAGLPDILCASCHGQESLFKFKYFHSPLSRKIEKKPFPF